MKIVGIGYINRVGKDINLDKDDEDFSVRHCIEDPWKKRYIAYRIIFKQANLRIYAKPTEKQLQTISNIKEPVIYECWVNNDFISNHRSSTNIKSALIGIKQLYKIN